MKQISASEFKAHCLALLDEVARTGEPLQVLKRGKPVARVIQAVACEASCPQDTLRGTVRILRDIVPPALPPQVWEVESEL
ncbi:MAG: type II toxin-antitoxin system Phd/YefM family antitoxin [Phycisphaerales bacterium]|nr:MAG: type II toxin-antitoxin system Phd/YefM family antitoxin [Phycisphaerales bacterium]